MDDRRFDALARSLAVPKTRRGLLGTLAALGAGLVGAQAADAQVSQVQCGNTFCEKDPGKCNPGCVCCIYTNPVTGKVINSRCRPPGTCAPGQAICPPGQVVDPSAGCVGPTTTPAPTTTTTTTTAAPTCSVASDCGDPCAVSCNGGICSDVPSLPKGAPCGEGSACIDRSCQAVSGGCTVATRCIVDVRCPSGCSDLSFCEETAEGAYVCNDYTDLLQCSLLTTCTTSEECGPGHVCIPDTCCEPIPSVCVPVCGASGANAARVAAFGDPEGSGNSPLP